MLAHYHTAEDQDLGFRVRAQVPARILAPPELMYRHPFHTDDKGRWDLRFVQFHRPATLVSYGIVSFVDASLAAGTAPKDPSGIPVSCRISACKAFAE